MSFPGVTEQNPRVLIVNGAISPARMTLSSAVEVRERRRRVSHMIHRRVISREREAETEVNQRTRKPHRKAKNGDASQKIPTRLQSDQERAIWIRLCINLDCRLHILDMLLTLVHRCMATHRTTRIIIHTPMLRIRMHSTRDLPTRI